MDELAILRETKQETHKFNKKALFVVDFFTGTFTSLISLSCLYFTELQILRQSIIIISIIKYIYFLYELALSFNLCSKKNFFKYTSWVNWRSEIIFFCYFVNLIAAFGLIIIMHFSIEPLSFSVGSDCKVTGVFDLQHYSNFDYQESYKALEISFTDEEGQEIKEGYSCRSDNYQMDIFEGSSKVPTPFSFYDLDNTQKKQNTESLNGINSIYDNQDQFSKYENAYNQQYQKEQQLQAKSVENQQNEFPYKYKLPSWYCMIDFQHNYHQAEWTYCQYKQQPDGLYSVVVGPFYIDHTIYYLYICFCFDLIFYSEGMKYLLRFLESKMYKFFIVFGKRKEIQVRLLNSGCQIPNAKQFFKKNITSIRMKRKQTLKTMQKKGIMNFKIVSFSIQNPVISENDIKQTLGRCFNIQFEGLILEKQNYSIQAIKPQQSNNQEQELNTQTKNIKSKLYTCKIITAENRIQKSLQMLKGLKLYRKEIVSEIASFYFNHTKKSISLPQKPSQTIKQQQQRRLSIESLESEKDSAEIVQNVQEVPTELVKPIILNNDINNNNDNTDQNIENNNNNDVDVEDDNIQVRQRQNTFDSVISTDDE